MRPILLVLILIIVALIAAIATGFLNIDLIRGAKVPQVSATDNGVTAQGGQAPAFDVQTGSVTIGNPQLPSVNVNPAGNDANAAAPAATQPAPQQQPQAAQPNVVDGNSTQ